jgi:putative FmdB family regulatory protein
LPIYEYECTRCSFRFELKQSFNEDAQVPCPQCGASTQRIFSPVTRIFKGSGFYCTDSRRNYNHLSHKGDRDKTTAANMKSKKDTYDDSNRSDE